MITYTTINIKEEHKEEVEKYCNLNKVSICCGMLGKGNIIYGNECDINKVIFYYNKLISLSDERDRKLNNILSKGIVKCSSLKRLVLMMLTRLDSVFFHSIIKLFFK